MQLDARDDQVTAMDEMRCILAVCIPRRGNESFDIQGLAQPDLSRLVHYMTSGYETDTAQTLWVQDFNMMANSTAKGGTMVSGD